MRTRLTRLVLLAALAGTACKFSFDRDVSPGEIRGVLQKQRSGDGAREGVARGEVRAVGTPYLARSSADGKFALRGIPSGTHALMVSWDADGDGRPDAKLRLGGVKMEPIAGANDPRNGRDLGGLLLEPAGRAGGVITKDGQPVVGAAVSVKGQPALTARTDAQGRFLFPFLARGSYEFAAMVPKGDGLVSTDAGKVDVVPNQLADAGTTAVPADAPQRVTIQGQLVAEDAIHDPDYASFSLELVGGGAAPLPITILPEGSFSVDVPVGLYSLHLKSDLSVAEVWLPQIAVYQDAQLPPLYVFDASKPFDYDQDGKVEDDDDSDNDGTPDKAEAPSCVFDPDGTKDADGDGLCDSVDPDADADGIDNARDDCPLVSDAGQLDRDGDGVGDACDNCPAAPNSDQDPAACDGSQPLTCAVDNGGCDVHASCQEVQGGISCHCSSPWTGDGKTCVFPGWTVADRTPGARVGPAGAWDPKRQQLVTFGGSDAIGTWALPLTDKTVGDWRFLDADGPAPEELSDAKAFWDGTGDQLVAIAFNSVYMTMHVYAMKAGTNLPTWEQLTFEGGPMVSLDSQYVGWDDAKRRVLVCCDTNAGTLWTFDIANKAWANVAVVTGQDGAPAPATGTAGAFDPIGQRLFAFGPGAAGNDFVLDLSSAAPTWKKPTFAQKPPGRAGAGVAYDASHRRLWLVGGRDANDSPLADAWSLDVEKGTAWAQGASVTAVDQPLLFPVAAGAGAMATFGGSTATGATALVQTLPEGAASWTPLVPDGTPPPELRSRASFVWDPDGAQAILVGGENGNGEPQGDVYVFTRARGWEKAALASQNAMPARSSAQVAWDEANKRAIVYGGLDTQHEGFWDDTWALTVTRDAQGKVSAAWAELPVTSKPAPPDRQNGSMLVDTRRERALLVGGRSGDASIWALDLTGNGKGWTQVTYANGPNNFDVAFASYDAPNDRVIVVGSTDSGLAAGTVNLDGTPEWTAVPISMSMFVHDVAGYLDTKTGHVVFTATGNDQTRRGVYDLDLATGAINAVCPRGIQELPTGYQSAFADTGRGLILWGGYGAPNEVFVLGHDLAICSS